VQHTLRKPQRDCIRFFIKQKTGTKVGKPRKITSLVGELRLTAKQVQKLGLEPRSRLSPLLQKCCLRLAANESYQNAELEMEALTGVKVGHSTQQKLVLAQDIQLPEAKQSISEVSVLKDTASHMDGGKVRLRGEPKAGCHWRDYKAVRLQSRYYAAFFDENQSLVDYVNSQQLVNPLVCLGDGHDGVWNLVREFGSDQSSRCEILDWFHLVENLYKVGGSLKRVKAAKALLWQGLVSKLRLYLLIVKVKNSGILWLI
jgi:hypothetical protein